MYLYNSQKRLAFSISADGKKETIKLMGVKDLEYDTWYNATATHISGEGIKLYLDGVLEASALYTKGIYDGNADIFIGKYGIAGHFKGTLDEVKIGGVGILIEEL